jgi:methylmalonyl-CoA mutase, N-terminal domain
MLPTSKKFSQRFQEWGATNSERLKAQDGSDRTLSRLPVEAVYTQLDLDGIGFNPISDLGLPGEFPYTRGINPGMYREGLWVMGQYSGYASPKATNKRIRSLLDQGQKGFSIALDLPTQIGLDSDDPRSRGEVGKVGVPIDTVDDMIDLLEGIPLDKVRQIRTTANAIGPLAVSLFVVASEELGFTPNQFRVMLQNDSLKEYVARGTYIFPPAAGLRFSVDVIEYCARNLPHWEPIEFCGYHIRDSGSDAVQEVAFAMANGFEYMDETLRRGVTIEEFGHALWLFLSAHQDLFEEVAKFRAARRVWARQMRERYGASDQAAKLNIFCYTLGSPQTLQEPVNNVVRIAYQALAAVLGGVQTLASTAYDEAVQLPSDDAVRLSLRTQQILAYETGVARSADPLAGSYLVESMTNRLEAAIIEKLAEIEKIGGGLRALETGWIAQQIEDEAYRQQMEVESGSRVIVGVNRFQLAEKPHLQHRIPTEEGLEEAQIARLHEVRARRDPQRAATALTLVCEAAKQGTNTVPAIIEAVRARSTVGEIASGLKEVWGEHRHGGN